MHTIRRYLRSYRYYRAAASVIFLLFLLHSAVLSLIFYFSGSDTISERLSETIPLEAGFQNSNYFGKNYHGGKAESEKEIPFLKQTISTLEALAVVPGVTYYNYQIGMQFYLDRVFPRGVPRKTVFDWATATEMPDDDDTGIRGDEWEETGLQLAGLSGIRTKDFFAHNNIALLKSTDAPLTDASAYVPHTTVVRDEDGTYRPVRLGDQIEIYDYNVSEPCCLHTCVVEGIYQYFSKFDYRRNCVSMIYQNFNLIPYLNARENLEIALDITDNETDRTRDGVTRQLKDVGITGKKTKLKSSVLSGGEQQRVAIARALATGSDFIIADEPTGNLDAHASDQVIAIFKRLAHEDGKCVIMVTHNERLAAETDEWFEIDQENHKIVPNQKTRQEE